MTDAAIIRIMLVDDHPLVRDGLRARLEAMAHLTCAAHTREDLDTAVRAIVKVGRALKIVS